MKNYKQWWILHCATVISGWISDHVLLPLQYIKCTLEAVIYLQTMIFWVWCPRTEMNYLAESPAHHKQRTLVMGIHCLSVRQKTLPLMSTWWNMVEFGLYSNLCENRLPLEEGLVDLVSWQSTRIHCWSMLANIWINTFACSALLTHIAKQLRQGLRVANMFADRNVATK